ncbi:hypothetical protein Cgig2_032570 [Carnegiea gigantea]|uniref:Uncharacterized protein n=1 Tax=Carnegiea gigantea TaxID=171969 RepID=A0A9Q1QSR1_9CARY|nr:hypothetical protein Cgig2_032570 [Carnegiea gigantea]
MTESDDNLKRRYLSALKSRFKADKYGKKAIQKSKRMQPWYSVRCEEQNVHETNQHESNSNQLKEDDIMRIKYQIHFPVNQPTDEFDKYPRAQSNHCTSPSNSTKTIAVCTRKPIKAGTTKIRLTWMVSGMNKHEKENPDQNRSKNETFKVYSTEIGETRSNSQWKKGENWSLQEKTRAAAAPRKPKKGAVSSPLKTDDMIDR